MVRAASRLRSGANGCERVRTALTGKHRQSLASASMPVHALGRTRPEVRLPDARDSQVEYRAATKFAATRSGGKRLTAEECGAVPITPTIQQENAGSCHHCAEEQRARHRYLMRAHLGAEAVNRIALPAGDQGQFRFRRSSSCVLLNYIPATAYIPATPHCMQVPSGAADPSPQSPRWPAALTSVYES